MPTQWNDFEAVDEPQSAVRWDDYEPVEETAPVATTSPPRPDGFVFENKANVALRNPNDVPVDMSTVVGADIPLVNPEVIRSAINLGTKYTPNILTLAERLLPGGKEFSEGVRESATEQAAGMTTPKSVAMLPAFTIPYVGPALAAGMGGQAVGAGAHEIYEGLKEGDMRGVGRGTASVGGGGLMVVGGVMHAATAPVPTKVLETFRRVDATVPDALSRTKEAAVKRVAETAAKEPVAIDQVQQLEKPITAEGVKDATEIQAQEIAPKEVLADPSPLADQIDAMPHQDFVKWAREQEGGYTTTAYKMGEAMQTPEGAARLREMESKVEAERKAAFEAEDIDAAMNLANKKQFITEALESAVGVAKNKINLTAEQVAKAKAAPIATEVSKPAPNNTFTTQGEPLPEPVVTKVSGEQPGPAVSQAPMANARLAAERPIQEPYSDKHSVSLQVTATEWPKGSEAEVRASLPKELADKLDGVRFLQGEAVPTNKAMSVPARVELVFKNKGDAQAAIDYFKEPASKAVSEVAGVEAAQSMGGLNPRTEQAKAQLAQLTDSIATLAAEGKTRPAEAFSLGETLSRAKDSATAALEGLKAAGTYMKQRLEGKPVTTEYKGVLGDRHLALSESSVNARKWRQQVLKAVPDKKTREAISNWVDAGGDSATLTKAAAETKPRYKEGYERAQNLTPEERTVAENLKNYFDSRLQEAIDAGVLEEGIENYIHRTYEQDSPWKKGVIQELRSGLFTGKPALAKKRIFEYDFEAEKAGKRPVKDFAQRVTSYDLSLNKAIADRAAVKGMMEIKMSDGRPMIDVGGGGKVIENAAGEPQATIINRSQKKIDPNDPKADRGDYKPYDHPALRKWKWATEDTAGKPVFVQGDVLIHPEAINDLQKLLGRSAIRQNPIGRAALGVSSTIKQTMLDLSGFHPVQIAVHGTEHRTFAPVKEIDFTNPDVRGLIRGGASVGETSGHAAFSEGLSGAGSSLTKHIPWVGERLQAYNSWLFEDYIPRLKVAMGLHALERNKSRFKDLSQDQVYQLTADQMNAAFGEQNYTMLGRSKTTQDALRLALLAPDFLEARGRFAAQAFTKYGAEQRQALILGAVTMYITARLLNKMMSDEYHFEPKNAFNLVVDGKSYGLRTVQGDLIHAATDPGKFINHRLNPVYGKPALEFVTGRDYFGRKRTTGEQLADFAKTPIPIGVRGAFEKQEQTLLDSFLNSFGLVTKRDSPSSDISQLAKKWKEKNDITTGPGEFIYDAEKDPYRPIKLAAERDDEAGVRSEVAKAMNEGISRARILEHFKLSERHNFAGSAANERKFVESLTEDEKKIYADAKEERKRIRSLVRKAMP